MNISSENGDRVKGWQDAWEAGRTGFHKEEVHQLLTKYFDQLFPTGNGRLFVPLCGKSVDMKWLSGKGVSVVGLDAVRMSLEQFFSEQGLKYTASKVSALGGEAEVFKTEDGKISLYCADLFKFSKDIEGTFDAVWDRGSLVAINREDVPMYVSIIKSLLKPGGICLHESFEYDPSEMKGPPHTMTESRLRELFEPECSVQRLEEKQLSMWKVDAKSVGWLIKKL